MELVVLVLRKIVPTKDHPEHDQDFCSRVATMDPDADIVVVFGGTNDFAHGDDPIGEMLDRCTTTFYGACHVLMARLIEKYPTATICFYDTYASRKRVYRWERAFSSVCGRNQRSGRILLYSSVGFVC